MNLDSLERLAREATPGPYRYDAHNFHVTNFEGKLIPYDTPDQLFKAAANPATVLELISALKTAREALEFYAECGEVWVNYVYPDPDDACPEGAYVYLQDQMKENARIALATLSSVWEGKEVNDT